MVARKNECGVFFDAVFVPNKLLSFCLANGEAAFNRQASSGVRIIVFPVMLSVSRGSGIVFHRCVAQTVTFVTRSTRDSPLPSYNTKMVVLRRRRCISCVMLSGARGHSTGLTNHRGASIPTGLRRGFL